MPDIVIGAELDEILAACRAYDGGDRSDGLKQVSGEFLDQAAENSAILGKAATSLPSLPAAGAAWLALLLGQAIESGASAEMSGPGVLGLFRSWLAQLPRAEAEGGDLSEPTPEQANLLDALPRLSQSVISHLARLPKLRQELADDGRLLDRLGELSSVSWGAVWVREALQRNSSGVVILHPPSGTGFKLRYENVATCFHLFSLIQSVIGRSIPGGRRPDPEVAAAARGQGKSLTRDVAWWHYGNPLSKTPSLIGSIWGDASVRSIPVVNGEQVILLWPPILARRGWSSSFFGPHLMALPSDITIEAQLSAEECRGWFEALDLQAAPQALPSPALRPWWKRW